MGEQVAPISYDHADAAKAIGISQRELERWVEKGIVRPVRASHRIRLYLRHELMKALLRLREANRGIE